MAMDIAGTIAPICKELDIPYVFKGSYRKAIDSGERNCPFFMLTNLPVCAAAISRSV